MTNTMLRFSPEAHGPAGQKAKGLPVCVRPSPAAGIRLLLVGGYQAQLLGRRLLSPRSHPHSRHALWNHIQDLYRPALRAVTEPAVCCLLTRDTNRQRCCSQPWSSPSEASVKRRNRRSECSNPNSAPLSMTGERISFTSLLLWFCVK